MAQILVLYGTTDGHTGKVAAAMADALRESGAVVDVVNAANAGRSVRPEAYEAVVVAASVHASGYQRAVRRWVSKHRQSLAALPTAFVSVCLGVLQKSPAVDRELTRIMTRFFETTGWRPSVTHVVAGALLYTRYNVLKRWTMRRIVAKAHGDVDTSRDYEYTDWDDVRAFAGSFAQRVTAAAV